MTIIFWTTLAALGVSLIAWHQADEKARRLSRANRELGDALMDMLERGERLEADLRRARHRPGIHNWSDGQVDRIASDMGLHVVPDTDAKEAASHAERGRVS